MSMEGQTAGLPPLLPTPQHQTLRLVINQQEQQWLGRTDLRVTVADGQQQVGLHCARLEVLQVQVDGTPAEYTLRQQALDPVPEPSVQDVLSGSSPPTLVAEYAYSSYAGLMQREQEPELLIQLPAPTPPSAAAAGGRDGGASDGAPLPFAAEGVAAAGAPSQAASVPEAPPTAAAANGATTSAADGVPRSATPAPAAGGGAGGAVDTPASLATQGAPAAAAGAGASSSRVVNITVTFRKPRYDSSILQQGSYLVATQQLRRARALFPCIDGPVYSYSSTAPFQYACSWDLHLTVDAGLVAVASGELVGTSVTHGGSSSSSSSSSSSRSSRKTFHYRVSLPTHAGNLCMAVGPFTITPAVSLLTRPQDKGLHAAAAAALAGTVTTVFSPAAPPKSGAASSKRMAGLRAAATAAAAAGSGADGVSCTHQQLVTTLRLLPVLLRLYERLLGGRMPWAQLQVAVVPASCLVGQVQAGLGCVFLSSDLLLSEDLLDPVPATLAALAAGLAHQYFGCLLVAKGPEDIWLQDALAGWLQGAALKAVMGGAELSWQRWQDRQLLVEMDDGAQLAPLCQRPRQHMVGMARTWGLMYGTQALEPSCAAAWKAVAVLSMLERRIGEAELSSMVQQLVGAARPATAAPTSTTTPSQLPQQQAGGLQGQRLLDAARFLRLIGKKDGHKKEMIGFGERWLYGAGVPHIEAALRWDPNPHTLQLALRQHGPASVIKAARRALAVGSSSGDSLVCQLKVEVRELDSTEEVLVQLGPEDPLQLQDIKVKSRVGLTRKKRAEDLKTRLGTNAIINENQLLEVPEEDLRGVPVLWVELDPQGQWLAGVQLRLPLNMWQLLFTHHKDVQSQAAAVVAVAQLPPSEPQALLLARVLADSELFCRVRAAAAVALGATATDAGQVQGANLLMRFFREHCYDPATGLLCPNNFSDVALHWVLQAVPAGLALVRDAEGYTPGHVLSLLLDVVRHNDNDFNTYDDTFWLAAWVTALGDTRPSSPAELQRVLGELDRQLAREAVIGSWQQQVGAACLKALAQLAVTHSCYSVDKAGPRPGADQQPAGWQGNGHQQQQGAEEDWMEVDTEGQDQQQQQQQNGGIQHQVQVQTQQQAVGRGVLRGVQQLLLRHLSAHHSHHLRKAALSGLLLLATAPGAAELAAGGQQGHPEHHRQQQHQEQQDQEGAAVEPSESEPAGEQLVRAALQWVTQVPSLQLQLHVLTEALDLLNRVEEAPPSTAAGISGMATRRAMQQQLQASLGGGGTGAPLVTPRTALALHHLLLQQPLAEVPVLRHAAFMLLQRALGQAPTLYRESEEDEDDLLPTVNTLTVSNKTGAPQGTAPAAAPSSGRPPLEQQPTTSQQPQQSLSRPAGSMGAGPSYVSGGARTATTGLGKVKLSFGKKLAGARSAGAASGGAASAGGGPASSAGGAAAGSGGAAGPSTAAAPAPDDAAAAVAGAATFGGAVGGVDGGPMVGPDALTAGRHRLAVSQGAGDKEATGPAAEAAAVAAAATMAPPAADVPELAGVFHSAADAAAAAVAAGGEPEDQAPQKAAGVLGKRQAGAAPSEDSPAAKRQQRMPNAAGPALDTPVAGAALAAAASAAGGALDAAAALAAAPSMLGAASSAMPSMSGVTAVGSTLTGAKLGKFRFKVKQQPPGVAGGSSGGGTSSTAAAAVAAAPAAEPPAAAAPVQAQPLEATPAPPEQQQQQQPAPPAGEGGGARGGRGSRKLRPPKRPGST